MSCIRYHCVVQRAAVTVSQVIPTCPHSNFTPVTVASGIILTEMVVTNKEKLAYVVDECAQSITVLCRQTTK